MSEAVNPSTKASKAWRDEQKKLGRVGKLIWVTSKEWDLDVKPLLEKLKRRRLKENRNG